MNCHNLQIDISENPPTVIEYEESKEPVQPKKTSYSPLNTGNKCKLKR